MSAVMILVFCAIASGECKEVQPSLETMSLQECMITGQRKGALWLEEHPTWRLDRVKCEMGERRKNRERAV